MRRSVLPLLLLTLLCLAAPRLLTAQVGLVPAQEETVTTDGDTIIIRALDFQEVPEAFTSTNSLLGDAGELHPDPEQVAERQAAVDTAFAEINAFLQDSMVVHLNRSSIREIEQIEQRAALFSTNLARYSEQVLNATKDLEEMLRRLSNEKKMWELTLETTPEEVEFEARIRRIERTVHLLDSVSSLLQEDLGRILALQDSYSDKDVALKDLQDRVKDRKAELTATMFSRDEIGLFGDLYNLKDSTLLRTHIEPMKRTLDNDLQILGSEYLAPMISFAVLFFLLLGFAYWYRRHFARLMDLEKFAVSEMHLTLVNAPITTMIFVSALLVRFSLGQLPQTLGNVNGLFLAVPMVIILVRMYGDRIKNWLILFFVLLLFSMIYELFYYPDILQRVVLLFLSLGSLGLYVWFVVKDPELEKLNSGYARRLFRLIMGAFAVMLVGAVIANLIGAFRLAEYLTLMPLSLTILAIAIQVSVKVVEAILYLFLSATWTQQAHVIEEGFERIVRRMNRLVEILLWGFFVVAALNTFQVREPVFDAVGDFLSKGRAIGDANLTIRSILLFLFIIWLSIMITRMISAILDKDVFTRVKTAKGIPSTVILMIRIALISIGFFLAAKASGMKLDNLSIIIGAFSVGIGFGLQNIFNNMVSGFIIAFERPIKVGDIVEVGTIMGEVKTIGLRASTIRTYDGSEVVVPNGNLISNEMINWTLSDNNRRMDIRVGVEYGTDPNRVVEILKTVAAEHPSVRKKPQPSAFFTEFGDSSLNFRLLAWCHIDIRLTVESELKIKVAEALEEAKITVPFPQTDLHIVSNEAGLGLTKPAAGSAAKAGGKPAPGTTAKAGVKPAPGTAAKAGMKSVSGAAGEKPARSGSDPKASSKAGASDKKTAGKQAVKRPPAK